MSDWTLRLRQAVMDNAALVAGILVVVVVLGGWLTYTGYAAPATDTREVVASSWEERGGYSHSAVVVEPNPVYETGTTLHNRSTYFSSIAPWLNGTFSYGYTGSEGNMTVSVESMLVVRAVEESRSGNETVLWQRTTQLSDPAVERVDAGERVTVPFAVNVSAVSNRTEMIEDRLGGSVGQSEVLVRTVVSRTGTVDGQQVDRTRTYDLPVELGTAYRVGNVSNGVERHDRMETTVVRTARSPLLTLGGPMLTMGGLLLLGAVLVGTRREGVRLSDDERERLRHQGDRAEFDEWITTIRLPESVRARERAHAASLADLVDFAIDSKTGVVESPDDGSYYVVTPDLLYVYDPPADATSAHGDDTPGRNDRPASDDE
ncbi:DUF5305 domain-containing protein [Halomarina oriensis]|uniref:DUF5305 domain-containing protein n=1 Tax=Halomarina oriensis TaxID=671145 RepID=A0A6B0GIA9_9EURY|nr:DUF5305 domain-containing protein [Halomarina oriensis]MWG33541.1 hypothetical protein [Halomarina oriensis]